MKEQIEANEELQLDEIVKIVLDQDVGLSKEFETEVKAARERISEKLDITWPDDCKDLQVKWQAQKSTLCEQRHWDSCIRLLTNFKLIK